MSLCSFSRKQSLFHKCKRELLKKELKDRNLKQEIDELISKIGEEDVPDEAYEKEESTPIPFMSTQVVALDALCDFYDLHGED